ncbi:MAG: diguanylate cyclase [Pseudomonadota bacterium]|nr:diguanylate cyclase [Pseudomonadota bacterium]
MPDYPVEDSGFCLHSAQMPVITGFCIMILLLIGVAAIGVSHIRILSGQLTAIVAERNLKSELASSMKGLHDARYQSILLAGNLADPFERDEQWIHFSEMAREFIVLRDRFLALPLDETELAAWNEVRKGVRVVENLTNEAFDLMRADQRDLAKRMIQRDLRPHQLSMMSQWSALVEMQRVKNTEAVDEAAAVSKRARGLVLGLSTMALLVAVGVAIFVVRVSRRMEADLFQEREHAVVTLRSLGDAVIRFDQEKRVSYLNPAAETLLGTDEDKAAMLPAGEVLHLYERESRADLTTPMLDDVLNGMAFVLPPSASLLSSLGMECEVEGKCSCIHGPDGGIIGGVLVMSDVTEARELQRKLLWHSDHDVLTGLSNRYAFEERLAQSLSGKRALEMSSSLLIVSLDHLKQVREQAGHACSDELVRQVSRLLTIRVRDSDFLARMGEDEFGILLQSCPDEMAERIADQIRDSVAGFRQSWQGDAYQVGVHVGVAHYSAEQSREECLALAYAALHEAETQGPGRVVVRRPATRPFNGVRPEAETPLPDPRGS